MRVHFLRWLVVIAATGVAIVSVRATVLARATGSPATTVQLVSPTAAVPTADGGFLVTDEQKCTVSKVSSTGTITPVAGDGTCGASGDGGPANSAELDYPTDAVPTSDGGFLIAEGGAPRQLFPYAFPLGGARIRKVSASGKITTVAGNGQLGYTGDGGSATQAEIQALTVTPYNPPGAAVATPGSGFLLTDVFDCVVRKVSGTGTISTVAGDGVCGVPAPYFGPESCPTTSLCVADVGGTGAVYGGNGANGVLTGDPSSGASAPWGLENNIDPFTAGDESVPSTSVVSCAPGGGLCVTTDDYGNVVSTTDAADEKSASWKRENVTPGLGSNSPNQLAGVSCPSTSLCVANDSTGGVWTSGDPSNTATPWVDTTNVDPAGIANGISCPTTSLCVLIDYTGNVTALTNPSSGQWSASFEALSGSPDLTAISCHHQSAPTVETLCAIADDSGDIWTSTDPQDGHTATWTESTGVDSGLFNSISCPTVTVCLATDQAASGLDHNIVRSTNADSGSPTWTVQTGVDGGNSVGSVSCPSADVCVADTGGGSSLLVSENASSGTPPTWSPDTFSNGDGGPATDAILDSPVSAVPTADGGFLITQFGHPGAVGAGITGSCAVRQVSSAGNITTVAGGLEPTTSSGTTCGFGGDNGAAGSAQLNEPTAAVPTPGGGFLIADYGNNRVRQVSGSGTITTVAGDGQTGTGGNGGSATSSPLTAPSAAVPLKGGGFLIGSFSANSGNSAVVRDVSSTGTVKTVAGTGPHDKLTVSEAGTGAGKVSSTPAGISCPHTCAVAYPAGTHVTLSANAAPGSVFSGWKGSGCSGTKTCVLTMSQGRSVTATFTTLAPVCALVHPSGAVHVSTKTVNGHKQTTGSLELSLRCSRAGTVKLSGVVKESHPSVKSFSIASRTLSVKTGQVVPVTLALPGAAVTALDKGAKESAVLKMLASDPKGSRSTTTTLVLSVSRTAAGRAAAASPLGAELSLIGRTVSRLQTELGLLGRGARRPR
jgi:hypothetical protein